MERRGGGIVRFVSGWLITMALLGALSACGGKPMAFPAPESELGDRPGMLTGPSGAWTVYQR